MPPTTSTNLEQSSAAESAPGQEAPAAAPSGTRVETEATGRPLRLAINYRVCWHWRVPVFQRLARWPGIQLRIFHGGDFPGTKVVNTKNFGDLDHVQLATLRVSIRKGQAKMHWPICPALPFRLAAWRPDVILTEGGSNLLNDILMFAYATLTRTPVVWWTLGELRKDQGRSRAQRFFRSIVCWMERRSAALLGYSSMALEYFDAFGYPKDKQFRAVNCIDTDRAKAEVEAARGRVESLREAMGLRGKRVLLYVGAIAQTKRLEDLIDVYARMKAEDGNLALLIVGDGAHLPALKEYASRSKAPDILFTGQVIEGVSAYFLLGDIFVLPGLGGLAISQAMVHSLPVVATEADGCELDLIEEGKNGYRLAVGDQAALEHRLREMLLAPGRAAEMGRHSRWIIDHRHNINTYMDNVVAACRHAYRQRARKRSG